MKMKTNIKEKRKPSLIITEIIMIILAIIMLIPIYYLVVTTMKTPSEALNSPMGLPSKIHLQNYVTAWNAMGYLNVLKNNLIITISSVLGILCVSSMAGYAIARRSNKLNSFIFILFLMGMMIPYQMGIVSLYKLIISMHLMNKLAAVILINIANGIPVATFMFKNFIVASIPIELEEAAFLDGYGVFGTFWKVCFPLLKPVAATIAILNTIIVWNDFMTPLLFLQSRSNSVILLEVVRNVGQFQTDWTLLFPMMLLGVAPLLIFFVFMQDRIIKGVSSGAVKG